MVIWDVRSDGQLGRNRVKRAAWELFQQLNQLEE
jgi:hypothetical protein